MFATESEPAAPAEAVPEKPLRWWQKDPFLVLALVALGLLLRCWNLSFPYEQYFDETYYVKAAAEYLAGHEDPNNVHPPMGKLLIGAFMEVWWGVERYVIRNWNPHGFSTISWRLGSLVCGLIMVALTYYMARAMFRDRMAAVLCAFFLDIDFLHIVQCRIAMLDMFQAMFVLVGLYCTWLYIQQRDRSLRWALWANVAFGFGMATKWNTMFAMVGALAAVLLLKDFGESFDVEAPFKIRLLQSLRIRLFDALKVMVSGLAIVVAIYALSYLPLCLSIKDYDHLKYSRLHATFNKIVESHKTMWTFRHSDTFTHRYMSVWWQWPTDVRPIWYFYKEEDNPNYSFFPGLQGTWWYEHTIAENMNGDMNRWVYGIIAMGSPFVWWLYLIFMVNIVVHVCIMLGGLRFRRSPEAVAEWRRAWQEGAEKPLLFCVLTYLPQVLLWSVNRGFFFYMLPCTPLMCLVVGFTVWDWRTLPLGRSVIALFIAISVFLLVLFYPLLVAYPVPKPYMYYTLFFNALKKFWNGGWI